MAATPINHTGLPSASSTTQGHEQPKNQLKFWLSGYAVYCPSFLLVPPTYFSSRSNRTVAARSPVARQSLQFFFILWFFIGRPDVFLILGQNESRGGKKVKLDFSLWCGLASVWINKPVGSYCDGDDVDDGWWCTFLCSVSEAAWPQLSTDWLIAFLQFLNLLVLTPPLLPSPPTHKRRRGADAALAIA